jgi:hypothetical protein
VFVSDLTGDGRADLLVTAPSEPDANDGRPDPASNGGDKPEIIVPIVGSCLGEQAFLLDVDNDGASELVLRGRGEVGDAAYALPLTSAPTPVATGKYAMPSRLDVDDDDVIDECQYDYGTFTCERSTGGTLRLIWDPRTEFAPMLEPLDLDRDGLAEPWFVARTSSTVYRLVRAPFDLIGDHRTSSLTSFAERTIPVGGLPTVTVGDIDADGDLDLDLDLAIGNHVLLCQTGVTADAS